MLAWAPGGCNIPSAVELRSDSQFIVTVIAIVAFATIVIWMLSRVQSDIEAIRFALRGILTKHEVGPLMGLDGTGEAKIPNEPNLENYLHKLDGLNFIQPNPKCGLNDIGKIRNGVQFDLKDYFILQMKDVNI